MRVSQLNGPADNAGGSGAVMPLNVRPQQNCSRFWLGFNILTCLIACVALAISLANASKPSSSASTVGGVEASTVRGLSTWQEVVQRNLTAVQSDLAAIINGLRWGFLLFFSLILF